MWEKSKFNMFEEETKVRKNLGRLIHTLQHFPSTRSGVDTSSLLNLIEELESFSDQKTNSMHATQKIERKTYKSLCPGSGEINQTLKNFKPYHKSCSKNSSQMKEKDSQRPRIYNNYLSEFQKPKKPFNVTVKPNNTYQTKKVRGINQETSKSKYNEVPSKSQTKPENIIQSKNKLNKSKEAEKSVNLIRKKSKINFLKEKNYSHNLGDESATRYSKRSTIKMVRNPKENFKCKSHQCTPQSNETLQQIILGDNQAKIDKRSVVKKLTSYWNNLLNNEFEQKSSATESTGGSFQNFHILDRSTKKQFNKSETESENSSSTMKSRHRSESNINIMKRVEDLQLKNFTTAHYSTRELLSKKYPASTDSRNFKNEDYIEMLSGKEESDFNQNYGLPFLHTKDIIEVLQNTINTLRTFPSSEIDPLTKKMLDITVASSILKPLHQEFLHKMEVHADKMIEIISEYKENIDNERRNKRVSEMADNIPDGKIMSPFKKNLKIDMEYIVVDTKRNYADSSVKDQGNSLQINFGESDSCRNAADTSTKFKHESVPIESGNAIALLTPRINLSKVENAFNFFLIWQEFIWSNCYGSIGFRDFPKSSYHSFTIIYEEDIIIEEDSDEYHIIKDHSEIESRSNIFMFRSVKTKIEKYIEKLIDILENYLPDSPEELIRVLYQALVSILIWWVLIREIFIK